MKLSAFLMPSLTAAITIIVIAMAGGAFAAPPTGWTDQTVLINATVKACCKNFSAGNMTLGIDPSTSAPVYSTGNLTTVQCTKTTPFYVSALSAGAGGAANTTGTLSGKLTAVSPATNSPIPYTLYFTPSFTGSGFGSATATTLITGNGDSSHGVNVAATDAQAAQAGTYSDTVTLSISNGALITMTTHVTIMLQKFSITSNVLNFGEIPPSSIFYKIINF